MNTFRVGDLVKLKAMFDKNLNIGCVIEVEADFYSTPIARSVIDRVYVYWGNSATLTQEPASALESLINSSPA